MKPSTNFLFQQLARAIPSDSVKSICEWAKLNVKLPGSAISRTFDADLTPWIREPLDGTEIPERRQTTFIKPIQGAGSVAGEVRICFIIAMKNAGDVQYNWQNDEQADARWEKRVEKIFLECEPLLRRAPDRNIKNGKWKTGQIIFPHCNFIMQGVTTNRSVASDSIKYQVNEEMHDEEGWTPGRYEQAVGRTTAYWDHSIFNISNAGRRNSELHGAFLSGTQQHWEVKCPGCGLYHVMRTEWKEKEKHLGGLRYDAEGCRTVDGYDYTKLAATVRYEFPCGFTIHDEDRVARRNLSLSGRYGAPKNPGAPVSLASYTLEAVSIDYIRWLDLIMQKHRALRSLKNGDLEPYKKYLRERECKFSDDSDRPFFGKIELNLNRMKDREGLADRLVRFGALDYQEGEINKGELPHWWGLIQDVKVADDGQIHVFIVWEGKLITDEDAADCMKRHEVDPRSVVCDSGWAAKTHVYKFAYRHGYHCIKGGAESFYAHKDGSRKIYSQPKPLHLMMNAPPKYEYVQTAGEMNADDREPLFWFYSASMIRDRLAWLANGGGKLANGNPSVIYDIPGDVSEDFKSHWESEEIQPKENKTTGEIQKIWVQIKPRNDLRVCCCYIAMLMEMGGIIGTDAI